LRGNQRFGGPDKEIRSKRGADKLWGECGMGMERNGMTYNFIFDLGIPPSRISPFFGFYII
jgi:hypothetical protein